VFATIQRHSFLFWTMKLSSPAAACLNKPSTYVPRAATISVLSWNTCVRSLARRLELTARTEEARKAILSE
jgi:hypothetical protein